MKRHRTEYADPLSHCNPTVPADFSLLVERLMEKNPRDRFRSAAAVRDALRKWTAGDPETPMDVDPEQTEAEIVLELERTVKDPGAFFETVPVVVFADKGKKSASRNEENEEEDRSKEEKEPKPFPLWLIFIPAALILMCIGAGATGIVLYFLK
jgi:outer membrane translocation and assembly module TamA